MGELVTQETISEEDYRAIEEAVMETARGRWFLAEYAKRNRVCETDRVLEAVASIKSYLSREHEPADTLQLRLDLVDMREKIELLKKDIANSSDENEMADAQGQLNVVLDETEAATSNILTAAEKIQEITWEVSEKHEMGEECEKLDTLVTEIYTACSFQDLTGQRLRKVVSLIAVLEERLRSMVELWDEDELANYKQQKVVSEDEALKNGPSMPGIAQEQDQIDEVMATAEMHNQQASSTKVGWAEAADSEQSEDDVFIIEDDFENDKDMEAFTADLEEEHLQTPLNAEAMDDVEDDDFVEETSSDSSADDVEFGEEPMEPLHKRAAMMT